ncbi:MAG: DUF2510 domain-containing protein [Actinomycetota bacterium]
MRKVDAPPAGWYPDPQNRTRLRWWDGLDWTDIRRAVPSEAELIAAQRLEALTPTIDVTTDVRVPQQPAGGFMSRQDSQQLITEVRNAARAEVDRAADLFNERAQSAIRGVSPLIQEYASTATKWLRRAIAVAIVLLVAWFVFQVFVQASLFEWIGDRIDNLTDDSIGVLDDGANGVSPPG